MPAPKKYRQLFRETETSNIFDIFVLSILNDPEPMKLRTTLLCCLLSAAGSLVHAADKTPLTRYVDPFIGTATVGHTYPAATLPFAMVQVGPDTGTAGWEYCAGYHDADGSIIGFSHTHLSGTGCPDMGDILIMPVTGAPVFEAGPRENPDAGYRSRFDHANETARPGYYAVRLDDYDILAEMTLAPRTGFHRYTYPAGAVRSLVLDLGHGIGDRTTESSVRAIDERTLVGVRRSTGFVKDHGYYFCIRFSEPFTRIVSLQDGTRSDAKELSGTVCKMHLTFGTGKPLGVKVALYGQRTGRPEEHGSRNSALELRQSGPERRPDMGTSSRDAGHRPDGRRPAHIVLYVALPRPADA